MPARRQRPNPNRAPKRDDFSCNSLSFGADYNSFRPETQAGARVVGQKGFLTQRRNGATNNRKVTLLFFFAFSLRRCVRNPYWSASSCKPIGAAPVAFNPSITRITSPYGMLRGALMKTVFS